MCVCLWVGVCVGVGVQNDCFKKIISLIMTRELFISLLDLFIGLIIVPYIKRPLELEYLLLL